MTSCPPNQTTATIPRLVSRVSAGRATAISRPTLIFSSMYCSLCRRKPAISCPSRTKAFTTRIPARFSCTAVFSAERRSCTTTNSGWARCIKPQISAPARGSTASVSSASCVSMTNIITTLPASISTARSSSDSPWLAKPRTRSTSLESRVINWPVCRRSRLAKEKPWMWANSRLRMS